MLVDDYLMFVCVCVFSSFSFSFNALQLVGNGTHFAAWRFLAPSLWIGGSGEFVSRITVHSLYMRNKNHTNTIYTIV